MTHKKDKIKTNKFVILDSWILGFKIILILLKQCEYLLYYFLLDVIKTFMALQLRIKVRILNDPCRTLVPEYECKPSLSFFLSSDVDSSAWISESKSISHVQESWNVVFHIKQAPTRIDMKSACLGILMLCAFKMKEDEQEGGKSFGYERKEPIGEGIVYLYDLLRNPQQELIVIVYDKASSIPVERCTIALSCIECKKATNILFIGQPSLKQDTEDAEKMLAIEQEFRRYYSIHRGTDSFVEPMHLPTWNGNHIPLPACMWMLSRLNMNVYGHDYYLLLRRCFDITLSLCNWNEEEFCSFVEKQMAETQDRYHFMFHMCVRTFAICISIVSYACDYISDLSMGEPIERFKVLLYQIWAGDCEDLAFVIFLFAMSILENNPFVNKKDRWYQCMKSIVLLYVPTMITGSATNPSMTKRTQQITDKDFICHVYTAMLSRVELQKRIQLRKEEKTMIQTAMQREFPFRSWEKYLPNVILEGTSMNCPLMNPMESYLDKNDPETEQVCQASREIDEYRESIEQRYHALTKMNIELMQTRSISRLDISNFSTFYHKITNVWMDLRRYGLNHVFDFSLGYGTGLQHTYGISTCSWCNPSTDPEFVLEPIFRFNQEQMNIGCKTIEKQPPLVIPKVATSETKIQEPLFLKELEKHYPPPGPSSTSSNHHPWKRNYVSYRVNRWEKTEIPDVKSALCTIMEQRLYTSIHIVTYPITADGELYIGEIQLYK